MSARQNYAFDIIFFLVNAFLNFLKYVRGKVIYNIYFLVKALLNFYVFFLKSGTDETDGPSQLDALALLVSRWNHFRRGLCDGKHN